MSTDGWTHRLESHPISSPRAFRSGELMTLTIICNADLVSKFHVGLKSLVRQILSETEFYGDLVYNLKKIVGSNNFSAQFIKIISHYKDWL